MKAAAKFSFFLCLASSLTCLSNDAAAQARSTASSGSGIAVIDVSYVFKNHARFKAAMDSMKEEVQAYEETLRSRHQALAKKKEQLEQFRVGSKEYEQSERALADEAADLQIDTQLKKKEFLQRESTVYFKVYNEVSGAVRQFAEQNGVDLVLRYNGDEINPEDRASVLQGVNRPLVYKKPSLDITRDVLDRLNRTTASRPTRQSTR